MPVFTAVKNVWKTKGGNKDLRAKRWSRCSLGTLIVVTVWWNYSHFHGNFCELDPKATSTPHKRLPWQKPKPALWEQHASSRKNFSEPAVCERSGQPSAHGSVAAQVDVHGGQRHFSAEPAHQSRGGAILALPVDQISEAEQLAGRAAREDALLGPSTQVTVGLEGGEDPDQMLEVLIAEFNRDVRTKLDKKPSRSRRTIVAFDDDASNLPNFADLLAATESWIESVELRNDEFQTAMEEPLEDPVLAQLQAMQASLDARFSTLEENVAALQRHPPAARPWETGAKGQARFFARKGLRLQT